MIPSAGDTDKNIDVTTLVPYIRCMHEHHPDILFVVAVLKGGKTIGELAPFDQSPVAELDLSVESYVRLSSLSPVLASLVRQELKDRGMAEESVQARPTYEEEKRDG